MAKKILNVPNLRFPGFEDVWEFKKLESAVEIISGIALQSEEISEDDSGISILRGINITEGFIRHNREIDRYYTKAITGKIQKFLLDEKDLVIGMDGSKVGKNVALISKSDIGSILIQRVARVRALSNSDINYIFQNIFSSEFQKYVDIVNTSSAIPHISLKQIQDYEIGFPTLSEQKTIASFFYLIDKRIQTQNKIIEGLKLQRKVLSKKLFNEQLRFSEFNEEWKTIKLKEILTVSERIKPTQIDKNKLITVKLHLKGVAKNDNSETLSLGATNYFVRKKGQFIYGKQNLFNGAFGLVPDELDGFLSSADVPALDINHSKANSLFLLYFLGQQDFYKRLEDIATGSGSKRIHEATFLNIEISFPTLEEQTRIAEFLSMLDKKIEHESNVLQLQIQQKKYLLQNLFI